jgi:hypothetical protein
MYVRNNGAKGAGWTSFARLLRALSLLLPRRLSGTARFLIFNLQVRAINHRATELLCGRFRNRTPGPTAGWPTCGCGSYATKRVRAVLDKPNHPGPQPFSFEFERTRLQAICGWIRFVAF